ncbi:MAG TPA: hypothetical protein DCY48_02290 [Candidatus Magasanikbacteria bacterium]|nr:hypothetical protein [Candidatus Magasanikbacteria bacterium]
MGIPIMKIHSRSTSMNFSIPMRTALEILRIWTMITTACRMKKSCLLVRTSFIPTPIRTAFPTRKKQQKEPVPPIPILTAMNGSMEMMMSRSFRNRKRGSFFFGLGWVHHLFFFCFSLRSMRINRKNSKKEKKKKEEQTNFCWIFGFCFLIFVPFFVVPVYAAPDSDQDGLLDEEERVWYTDPENSDTDNDGYSDGLEIEQGYSPHSGNGLRLEQSDFDNDGLHDAAERAFGTNMGDADSDDDGYNDFEEILYGYDPLDREPIKKWNKKIVIDLSRQQLFVVVNAISVLQFPVSTGNPYTPTPPGNFSIERKVDTMLYQGLDYYYPGVKWNLQFKPRYYIHTAYWHNDFGKRTRSHGCVNMREADVAVLYRHIDVGTPVEIIGKTPPKRYVVETE